MERPLARRMPVSRRASGRTELRHVPDQQLRSRVTPTRAVLHPRSNAREVHAAGAEREQGLSIHARLAKCVKNSRVLAPKKWLRYTSGNERLSDRAASDCAES